MELEVPLPETINELKSLAADVIKLDQSIHDELETRAKDAAQPEGEAKPSHRRERIDALRYSGLSEATRAKLREQRDRIETELEGQFAETETATLAETATSSDSKAGSTSANKDTSDREDARLAVWHGLWNLQLFLLAPWDNLEHAPRRREISEGWLSLSPPDGLPPERSMISFGELIRERWRGVRDAVRSITTEAEKGQQSLQKRLDRVRQGDTLARVMHGFDADKLRGVQESPPSQLRRLELADLCRFQAQRYVDGFWATSNPAEADVPWFERAATDCLSSTKTLCKRGGVSDQCDEIKALENTLQALTKLSKSFNVTLGDMSSTSAADSAHTLLMIDPDEAHTLQADATFDRTTSAATASPSFQEWLLAIEGEWLPAIEGKVSPDGDVIKVLPADTNKGTGFPGRRDFKLIRAASAQGDDCKPRKFMARAFFRGRIKSIPDFQAVNDQPLPRAATRRELYTADREDRNDFRLRHRPEANRIRFRLFLVDAGGWSLRSASKRPEKGYPIIGSDRPSRPSCLWTSVPARQDRLGHVASNQGPPVAAGIRKSCVRSAVHRRQRAFGTLPSGTMRCSYPSDLCERIRET